MRFFSRRLFQLYLAYVFCTSPIASGQIHSGLVETIEGVDLVRVRACQGVLSGDNFDVRGDSCCEAACGLRYFIIRELESKVGDVDVFACGIKIVNRRLHFANDTRLEELTILRDTPLLQVCVSNFGHESCPLVKSGTLKLI